MGFAHRDIDAVLRRPEAVDRGAALDWLVLNVTPYALLVRASFDSQPALSM